MSGEIKIKAFLDDTAQIIGPSFSFDQEAFGRSQREKDIARFVLDKAKTVYDAGLKLGGVKPLGWFRANLEHFVYKKKYSKNAEGADKALVEEKMAGLTMPADADERELALRSALVDFGKKLVKEDLVQGTWGNLSARLNEEWMLVTPSGIDYELLRPQDMVRVRLDNCEYDKAALKPTSERGLHASIYNRRPDVGAIIHTHSTYACVYAACEKDLLIPVTGIECAWHEEARRVFGEKIRVAEYGFAGSDKLAENTAKAVGDNMGAIMSHHGMIACGADLETAFANACLLENTARTVLKGVSGDGSF